MIKPLIDSELLVVRLARFERATYGLEVRCSIQLSYRREHGWISNRQIYVCL